MRRLGLRLFFKIPVNPTILVTAGEAGVISKDHIHAIVNRESDPVISLPLRDRLSVKKDLFAHKNIGKLKIAYLFDRIHCGKNKTKYLTIHYKCSYICKMELTIDLNRALNIGLKQEVILAYIEKNPGTTQKKISQDLKISQRTMFDMVESLISRELVEKAGWYLYSK